MQDLDQNTKDVFLEKLRDTKIDADSDISLLIAFVCLKSKVKGTKFSRVIQWMEDAGINPDELKAQETYDKVSKLADELKESEWMEPTTFVRTFLPFQSGLYNELYKKNYPNGGDKVSYSRLFFEMIQINLFKEECLKEHQYNPCQWLITHETFKDYWMKNGKTEDDFSLIAMKGDIYPYKKVSIEVRGNIAKAKKECTKKLHVGYDFLFKEYLAAKGIGGDKYNPYEFLANLKKAPNSDETIFVKGDLKSFETLVSLISKLAKEKPSTMMKALFYAEKNNASLELHFLLDGVSLEQYPRRLLINPSPFLFEETQEEQTYEGTDYMFASEVIRKAYFSQTHKRCYRTDTKSELQYDSVLYLYDSDSKEFLPEILKVIIKTNCQIAKMFMPESVFESGKDCLLDTSNGYSIQSIISIDTNLVELQPKKNILITLVKAEGKQSDLISIGSLSSIDTDTIAINDNDYRVSVDNIRQTKTIQQAIRKHLDFLAGNVPVSHYNSGLQYQFSKEIIVQYRFVTRSKYKTAVFSYKSHPNNGKQRKLIKNTEKGLNIKENGEIFPLLDKTVLSEENRGKIAKDIRKAYKDKLSEISLKTFWFLEHEELMTAKKYDQTIMDQFFSFDRKVISDMPIADPDIHALVSEIEHMTSGFTSEVRSRYMNQLYILFRTAFRMKYIKTNPLAGMERELSNRISEEQQEVRDALVKKSFTIDEQMRMLKTTEGSWTKSENSQTLIIAFRLFTGISSQEMAVLTWGDFEKITDYDAYQIKIKYKENKDNKKATYGVNGDWRRFRCVPIVKPLETLLKRKKSRLFHDLGLEKDQSKEVAEFPIFMKSFNKRTKKPIGYSSSQINAVCRDAVKSLNLDQLVITLPGEKEYVTDLNQYRADSFVTNFKYHANHTCKLTMGEINYVLGIEPPDTFSKHYCDYTNDAIQYIIAGKLYRWAVLLIDTIEAVEQSERRKAIVSGPYKDNALITMMVRTVCDETKVNLNVKCNHGSSISVLFNGEEES